MGIVGGGLNCYPTKSLKALSEDSVPQLTTGDDLLAYHNNSNNSGMSQT